MPFLISFSNIEDIAREAGSIDAEEGVLFRKCLFFAIYFFVSVNFSPSSDPTNSFAMGGTLCSTGAAVMIEYLSQGRFRLMGTDPNCFGDISNYYRILRFLIRIIDEVDNIVVL